MFERGGLKSGDSLLVHGGTSGIGTTAIQLAKAFGAFVATTAGSDEKVAACRSLGADLAINYRTDDFVEVVRNALPGGGVDVVLDMVGASYTARNIRCLKPDGRLVQIAFLEGSKTTLDLMPVMRNRLTLTGSTLRPRDVADGAVAPVFQHPPPPERPCKGRRQLSCTDAARLGVVMKGRINRQMKRDVGPVIMYK